MSESANGGAITAKTSNAAVATVSGTAPTFTVNAVGTGKAIISIADSQKNVVHVSVQVSN